MTRLFGQKKDKTTIAELEEYYANQNQNKTKTGKAWLMAFISILITVAVIVGLFYAGRWAYRAITDDSSNNVGTTSENANNGLDVDLPTFDGDIVGQGNQPSENTENSGSGSTSGSSSSSNTEGNTENTGVVTDEAASTTESNADRVTTPANIGGEAPIPNTGAGDFLIIIPAVTAVAGYYISRKHYSKQK